MGKAEPLPRSVKTELSNIKRNNNICQRNTSSRQRQAQHMAGDQINWVKGRIGDFSLFADVLNRVKIERIYWRRLG